jgi:Tfp pilus assembly protein PilX
MNTTLRPLTSARGHTLVVVLVFLTVGLMILGATMSRTVTNARLIERNNGYWAAVAAAEAATEKVMSAINSDYTRLGASQVNSRLTTYASRVPLSSENPLWARYTFSNGQGNDDATYVQRTTDWAVSSLISQYQGLSGYAANFRVVSNARDTQSRQPVTGAVRQDVQLATIPLFQFAIFYNMDLEINPGAVMTVRGRVHSNQNLYSRPGDTLTFNGDVTAAGNLIDGRKPGDPTTPQSGQIVFNGEHDGGVNSLNMPIGTDNTPANVRQIVERPPVGESPTSDMGTQRFYNKSDLVLTIRDNGVDAHGPTANGNSPVLAWSDISSFVSTNKSFFNKREGRTVQVTQIDVGKLKDWNEGGNPLTTALGRNVNSLWVEDLRTQTGGSEPGVRLVNGQTLPPSGLTVVTPQPLYVQGHYNVKDSAKGTSDTSQSVPAALIGDAITVLSPSWADGASTSSMDTGRVAANTTVNAAFLAGIVETVSGSYSGGVENFPRFLENWSGKTFTYNGSMIVMFPSRIATGTWKGTGSTYGIYNPPNRAWSFDVAFSNPTRLPPGTPEVRAVIRGQWVVVRPNTVGG